MAIKFTVAIFLLLLMQCQNDDMPYDDTPIDDTSLVGEWLLTESYVSPGGATDWKDVEEGYRYFFDEVGNYERTDFNRSLLETGSYEIKEEELYLYFTTEGEKDTLGYWADFNESKSKLTLSPSYPYICIEGCSYRFDRE
ncbi:hypothetical protein CLV90_3448 [Maribacter spongiicola]|uniref:Lipocalin-like domain-containing protein n=1 Tax=Maribacter spongiicola TaxID=1206753 RepID=A0A4R7JUH9_9FLAO|nr:lipocalin family protein [Maribacter spongiicola]TDT40599.1 hypothetical protein CLV90_3448 [Maribacter spongiicola]